MFWQTLFAERRELEKGVLSGTQGVGKRAGGGRACFMSFILQDPFLWCLLNFPPGKY